MENEVSTKSKFENELNHQIQILNEEKRKLEQKVSLLQSDLKEVLINRKSLENINEIILKMSSVSIENDNQQDNCNENNNMNSNLFDDNRMHIFKTNHFFNSNSNNFSTGISYKNENNCNRLPEWYLNLKSKQENKKNF